VLERLRESMKIPVWHDDQQGTAGVILAALYSALELTGRHLNQSKIVLFGSGAANIAAARLLIQAVRLRARRSWSTARECSTPRERT